MTKPRPIFVVTILDISVEQATNILQDTNLNVYFSLYKYYFYIYSSQTFHKPLKKIL